MHDELEGEWDIAAHTRVWALGGRVVAVRTRRISEAGHSRYEVALESNDERAVVDIPAADEARLGRRIEEAVSQFIDSLTIRGDRA
jgi:hypothetical protein